MKKKIVQLTEADLLYDKVMRNLETYTGFDNYQDFKNYVNHLPKINENYDYLDNHENQEIALAMEIVIQIGNLWEDGGREITQHMHDLLQQSILILTDYPNKTKQISSLIKHGNYYCNNMDILKCNTKKNIKKY